MSVDENKKTSEAVDIDYPPLLDLIVPGLVLVGSIGYAWTLRGITNAEMNLLLLRPLFALIWFVLLVVFLREAIPTFRRHRQWRALQTQSRRNWRLGLVTGSEMNSGLVVLATVIFSFFAVGNGAIVYLSTLFIYLAVAGYLLGDRHLPSLMVRATLCTLGLYLIMGVALDVRI